VEGVSTDARADERELARLMVEYQGGHLPAFEAIYAALARDLYAYLLALSRNGSVAQDLVQDTFFEMHRSRRTYLPPLPVRPWAFGIARNVHRRHRRAAARRARHEDASVDVASDRQAPAAPPGLQAQDIEDAVRRLPPSRREAWRLHHVHGFSFAEVARLLRIEMGAAKLRSSRAMNTLRALLGASRRTPP
jgi:RNA polymerase sigma-70 factor, ECF subfamily